MSYCSIRKVLCERLCGEVCPFVSDVLLFNPQSPLRETMRGSVSIRKTMRGSVSIRKTMRGSELPEDYLHSSACYYYTGVQGVYPVITYMELQDIDLTASPS
jgi:hypothetical protein